MAYTSDVKNSINKYREARAKRRELFGPSLSDTLVDIGKHSARSAFSTVRSLGNKFKEFTNRSKSKAFNKMQSYFENDKFTEDKLDSKNTYVIRNDKGEVEFLRKLSLDPGKLAYYVDSIEELNEVAKVGPKVKDQVAEKVKEKQEEKVEEVKPEDPELYEEIEEVVKEEVKKEPKKKEKESPEYGKEDVNNFAYMYYHGDTDKIKQDVKVGKDFKEILTEAQDSFAGEHLGTLGLGASVFWKTLKEGKSLDSAKMEEVSQDIDTLKSVEEELAELELKKAELLGVRSQIEDKYDLVTPEQKTQREFKEVLLASDKLIQAQMEEADFYKMDESSLLENQIITQEELVRVEEAELEGKFGKFSEERESTLKLPFVKEEEHVLEDEEDVLDVNYATDYIISPDDINLSEIELLDEDDIEEINKEEVEFESEEEEEAYWVEVHKKEDEEYEKEIREKYGMSSSEYLDEQIAEDLEHKKFKELGESEPEKEPIKEEDVELSLEDEEKLQKMHATLKSAQRKRDHDLQL